MQLAIRDHLPATLDERSHDGPHEILFGVVGVDAGVGDRRPVVDRELDVYRHQTRVCECSECMCRLHAWAVVEKNVLMMRE